MFSSKACLQNAEGFRFFYLFCRKTLPSFDTNELFFSFSILGLPACSWEGRTAPNKCASLFVPVGIVFKWWSAWTILPRRARNRGELCVCGFESVSKGAKAPGQGQGTRERKNDIYNIQNLHCLERGKTRLFQVCTFMTAYQKPCPDNIFSHLKSLVCRIHPLPCYRPSTVAFHRCLPWTRKK